MSEIPSDLKYSKSHEWTRDEGGVITIGITDHAQELLGDIVFVELPEAGANVRKGEVFGTIEAVKTVEDLYAPISGEVVEVNLDLEDDAERVNKDPYGVGWMIKIRLDEEAELDETLSADEYRDHTAGGA